ncbi:MAG TPA: hypothetical protein VMR86_12160 [Myxococcota bacterium]|nr:hypothetical protein [Myxococcota bacterium]
MRLLLPALLAAVLALGAQTSAFAADSDIPDENAASPAPPPGDQPPDAAPPKSLTLDRLLHPPAVGMQPTGKTYGGRDMRGWKEEFRKARQEVSDLEGKVEAGQEHLRSASAGEWNYSPAGGEITDPEVLKLRAQLKRDRQSLEASRQRLRDLDVEASLAGVPEDWRKPAEPARRPQ